MDLMKPLLQRVAWRTFCETDIRNEVCARFTELLRTLTGAKQLTLRNMLQPFREWKWGYFGLDWRQPPRDLAVVAEEGICADCFSRIDRVIVHPWQIPHGLDWTVTCHEWLEDNRFVPEAM